MKLQQVLRSETQAEFWINTHNKIDVSASSLFEFLSSQGFNIYFHSEGKTDYPMIVKVENNIVTPVIEGHFVKFLEEYLLCKKERDVFDYIMKSNYLQKKENI